MVRFRQCQDVLIDYLNCLNISIVFDCVKCFWMTAVSQLAIRTRSDLLNCLVSEGELDLNIRRRKMSETDTRLLLLSFPPML